MESAIPSLKLKILSDVPPSLSFISISFCPGDLFVPLRSRLANQAQVPADTRDCPKPTIPFAIFPLSSS